MNCNTCKMCESADKRLESFVASKAGEFETAFQRTIDQKGEGNVAVMATG